MGNSLLSQLFFRSDTEMYLESSRTSTLGVDVRLDSFTVESESNLRLKVVNYLFKKLRLFDWVLSTL